jgi:hypothetical protein
MAVLIHTNRMGRITRDMQEISWLFKASITYFGDWWEIQPQTQKFSGE